jgi:hypothetical protein
MLRDGLFIERSERQGWILTRDIDTATLYDLYTALRLAMSDEDLSIAGNTGWEARLRERLKDLQNAQKSATVVTLKDVLTAVNSSEGVKAAE